MKVLLEILVDTRTKSWEIYRAKEQVPNAGSDTLVGYRDLELDDPKDHKAYIDAVDAVNVA